MIDYEEYLQEVKQDQFEAHLADGRNYVPVLSKLATVALGCLSEYSTVFLAHVKLGGLDSRNQEVMEWSRNTFEKLKACGDGLRVAELPGICTRDAPPEVANDCRQALGNVLYLILKFLDNVSDHSALTDALSKSLDETTLLGAAADALFGELGLEREHPTGEEDDDDHR